MNFSLSLTGMILNVALGIRGIGMSVSVHILIIVGFLGLYMLRQGWRRIRRKH